MTGKQTPEVSSARAQATELDLTAVPRRLGYYETAVWVTDSQRHREPTPFLAGARLFIEGASQEEAERLAYHSRDEKAFLNGYAAAQKANALQVYGLPTCSQLGGVSMLGSRHERGSVTLQQDECGCHVDGMGILPDPMRVHRCERHESGVQK